MGFWDNLSTGLTTGLSQGSWVGPLIESGLALTAGLAAPKADPNAGIAYGNTKEGFEAKLAFEREQLAAQLAAAGGGGGGSGAALAAAQLAARTQLAGLKEKQMADNLAAMLRQQESAQQGAQNASNNIIQAAQTMGQTGMQGYQGIANVMSRYAR
jgi:hypothetical protein